MKILIATPLYPPEIGGPATYTKLLEEELPKRGIEVKVVKFSDVKHLPKIIRHLAYAWKVFRQSKSCDLVYAQDPVSVGLPALVGARIARKSFMVHVAGDYAWEQSYQRFGVKDFIDDFQKKRYGLRVEFLKKVQSFVVGQAVFVITPSLYFKKVISGWISSKQSEKIIVVHYSLNFSEVPQAQAFWRKDKKTMVSAGRLVPWKGFDVLIDILPNLDFSWSLKIMGDGPEKDNLLQKVSDLNLVDRVEFTGNLDRQSMLKHIAKADLFILYSAFESFSFQIAEAMKTGIPVIASRAGSFPEVIREGLDGLLVDRNDSQDLIKAIKLYDTNPELRKRLASSGQKRIDYFFVDRTIKDLIVIMKKAV